MRRRYRTVCGECGYEWEFTHKGKPGALVRSGCPSCTDINYITLPDPDGYAMRQGTLEVQASVLDLFAELGSPMTVRQIFYQLTVRGVVPKSDSGYRKVQRQVLNMRRNGSLPYGHVSDSSRWQLRPLMYDGIRSAMREWHRAYRRNLWAEQNAYVEIWVEKKALAGVISEVTEAFGVPLWPAGGFSSESTIYEAAEQIREQGKPAYVYHFGDFDPSGVLAAEKIQEGLERLGANITYRRAAVLSHQIDRLNLPTRKTKRSKHAKHLSWGNKPSCELDAIAPNVLRDMVRECITAHLDPHQYHKTLEAEKLERDTLLHVMENFQQFGTGTELFGGAS